MTDGIIQQWYNKRKSKYTNFISITDKDIQELIEEIKRVAYNPQCYKCDSGDKFIELIELIGDNQE